jgi:hypothetical protein
MKLFLRSRQEVIFPSRITVCGEIFNTSAASSELSPPKHRSAMTLAFAGVDLR